jgi:hypothetical protein
MTTLSDWLPLLQSEHGAAICAAAGCSVLRGVDLDGAPAVWLWWDYEQDGGIDTLTVAEQSALAFGAIAVLAESFAGECWFVPCPRVVDREWDTGEWCAGWSIDREWDGGETSEVYVEASTLPEAVRLAAMRAWNIEPITPGGAGGER